MTEDEAFRLLRLAIELAGSRADFAKQAGVSVAMVGMVLRGERGLSKPILDAIGLECVERTYRRKSKAA